MKQRYLLGLIFLWNIYAITGQNIKTINNCTCKTSDGGIYSLMPLRRTDGIPRFVISGKKYPGWSYTYNPCTPVDVGQNDPDADPNKICRNVAICKYAEIEKPREYFQVGLQRGMSCEMSQEGQIELVYKTNDPSIDNPHSRVVLRCDESASDPVFQTEDEDNYIFSIKHYCACRNRCPWHGTTSVSPPESTVKAAFQLKTTAKEQDGTIIVPAVAVIGAIVAVVIGVVLWRKFRARSNSLEGQRLIDGDQI
ncbi:hypothetical protein OS493_000742 [Desmophyllum pertusum]|uniref:Uncharacterized protein n=1 Tax=Desmophyllum pertusum TaxID=174260 RepID=A0A9X0DCH5_9CNID|nr:hypothetical protein OS493_000742 [Desmophyllum pertusum]